MSPYAQFMINAATAALPALIELGIAQADVAADAWSQASYLFIAMPSSLKEQLNAETHLYHKMRGENERS